MSSSFFDLEKFSAKKYFFPIQQLGWKFIGFWPGSDAVTKLQLAVAFLNVFEILVYCIFQFNFCYVNRTDLLVVLDAFTPLATQFTTPIKILVIVSRRHELKEVLDHLKNSFYSGEIDSIENRFIFIFVIQVLKNIFSFSISLLLILKYNL